LIDKIAKSIDAVSLVALGQVFYQY